MRAWQLIVMHCVERSASITSLFGRGLAGWAKEERRPRRHRQQQSRGGQDRISGGAWVNKELHKPHSARPPGRAIGEIEREGEKSAMCKPSFHFVRARPAFSHLGLARSPHQARARARRPHHWTMDMYIMDAFDNIEPSKPRVQPIYKDAHVSLHF